MSAGLLRLDMGGAEGLTLDARLARIERAAARAHQALPAPGGWLDDDTGDIAGAARRRIDAAHLLMRLIEVHGRPEGAEVAPDAAPACPDPQALPEDGGADDAAAAQEAAGSIASAPALAPAPAPVLPSGRDGWCVVEGRRLALPLVADEAMRAVLAARDLPRHELFSTSRARHLVRARRALIYALYQFGGYGVSWIARWFRRRGKWAVYDHTTVLHALRSHAAEGGLPLREAAPRGDRVRVVMRAPLDACCPCCGRPLPTELPPEDSR